jgi:glycogenin glucosyltransferase
MTESFVTLATNDEYVLGALVWAHSLREVNTTKKLVVMITNEVSPQMRCHLNEIFDHIETVDVLDSHDMLNLELLSRPNLGVTFTKLHCWRLTQYSKCVFMDADSMVIQNIDDIFDREEFSAAPDPGWPDCFNSGVFVFRPSIETYKALLHFAVSIGSFDGGDQGLLNQYFSDWATKDISKHLPFAYNCVSQAFYSYLPAAKFFHSKIKVVHFIGPIKPWHHEWNHVSRQVIPRQSTGFSHEFLQKWWDIFATNVMPRLSDQLNITGDFAKIELAPMPPGHAMSEFSGWQSDRERQFAWERGEIDYRGEDRFDNILNKINTEMQSQSGAQQPGPSSLPPTDRSKKPSAKK